MNGILFKYCFFLAPLPQSASVPWIGTLGVTDLLENTEYKVQDGSSLYSSWIRVRFAFHVPSVCLLAKMRIDSCGSRKHLCATSLSRDRFLFLADGTQITNIVVVRPCSYVLSCCIRIQYIPHVCTFLLHVFDVSLDLFLILI